MANSRLLRVSLDVLTALLSVAVVAAWIGAPILGGDPAGGVVHQPPGGDDSIFLNPCYIQLRYGPGAVSW
jgi:hypothetical protein